MTNSLTPRPPTSELFEAMCKFQRERPNVDIAYDRGDSDAYYGRKPVPELWMDTLGKQIVTQAYMSKAEVLSYWEGFYQNPSDRKDWG